MIFSEDYKTEPYWLEDISATTAAPAHSRPLPEHTDVAVIGSGYTGLNTAIQTSRHGRSTVILEAGAVGQGCSTRNGGQISTSIKPTIKQLAKKYGLQRAKHIRKEGEVALEWIEEFITQENIDCDFARNGRFHAAHTPAHYNTLAREADAIRKEDAIETIVVPKQEQHTELGSHAYHGGVVFPRHASLHAAKYHQALLKLALHAGVQLLEHCPATRIERIANNGDNQFRIETPGGRVFARDVMIATNGYTGDLTPWFQRRIIPIGSYVIATEPLDTTLIDELFPTNRIASDTCRVVYYFRASPDRTRVLFGGRVSANETDPDISGPLLHTQMCRIFPQLTNSRISHSWAGSVGYTFDTLAHTGVHQGMHYAMGYCGSGVSMASYLGMRAGLKILNKTSGRTALDNLAFPSRPFYTGKPWFLPSVVSWYQWRDRQEYNNTSV